VWKDLNDSHPAPVLTPEGRGELESQSRLLLERLAAFEAPKPGEPINLETSTLYEVALNEFVLLSHAIHSSISVENVPDDPKVVELGDDVVISSGVARVERCLIVHPLEASAKAGRISSESPLGRALMGRSVGESVVFEEQVITILQAARRQLTE
jgi:transcription elongation factor GreB